MQRIFKNLGADENDLVDVYIKQIRSILELAVPAWHGAITQHERLQIERVQKCVAHIILGGDYTSYDIALEKLGLEPLEDRRTKLCIKFAKKAEKHEKFKEWFKINNNNSKTRQNKTKYCEVISRHTRFHNSPISFLTRLLNEYHRKK